jgi:hypothetical protein
MGPLRSKPGPLPETVIPRPEIAGPVRAGTVTPQTTHPLRGMLIRTNLV